MDRRKKRASKAVMSIFLGSSGGSIDNVDVAEFDSDGSDLKALIVGIDPVQSGSGTPSPDNERPITGHSSVNVIVSPTLNPLDGTITNIPLGSTYYGGQLDVLTGVLTVTMAIADMGSLPWTYITNDLTPFYYRATVVDRANGPFNILSSVFQVSTASGTRNLPDCGIVGSVSSGTVFARWDAYADDTDFTNAVTGQTLCYELATPQIIQLTGQQISTFLGTNNVWCDSGKIIHLEY